ncbi:prepilin peptidase [Desulfovirgula thermocuniculi]|uniref:prepilin peptidase n=1 Tax=Desulfovirgula thermocuniculi TaxID=348842 RepID=UPI00047F1F6E|nr:A24 family peptidase [Desulfovirgula thermocuniculi]
MSLLLLKVLLLVLVAIAAYTDWKWRIIPNRLNLLMFCTGVAGGVLAHRLLESVCGAALGLALGLLPALILRVPVLAGIGGGDLKMMAALGAWYGPYDLLWVLAAGSVLAVAGGLANLARSGKLLLWVYLFPVRGRERFDEEVLPFGVYLAAGVYLVEAAKILLAGGLVK